MEDAALDWPDRFSIWNPEGEVVLHGRVQAWDIWGGATIRIMMHFPMSSILKKIIPLHYKIITWIFL